MTIASNTPDDSERVLKNSDLVGLLKAAGLTEFRLDNIIEEDEERLFKSSSLFDLVRSNLEDDGSKKDILKEEKHANRHNGLLDDIEKRQLNDGIDEQVSVGEDNSAKVSDIALNSSEENVDENKYEQYVVDEVVPANSRKIGAQIFDDETDISSSKDTFANSELSGQVEGISTHLHSPDEDPNFEKEIEELKADLTDRLAERDEELSNALKAIIGASNFIAHELEIQISDFVLSLASGLAGMKIDEIPAQFHKKISATAKQIAENADEVKVYLNSKDFEVINGLNIEDGLQYKFHSKENLKRGEFEVLSSKSSARVSLFDLAAGE